MKPSPATSERDDAARSERMSRVDHQPQWIAPDLAGSQTRRRAGAAEANEADVEIAPRQRQKLVAGE